MKHEKKTLFDQIKSLTNSFINRFILKADLFAVSCMSGIVTDGEEVELKDSIHFIQLLIHCVPRQPAYLDTSSLFSCFRTDSFPLYPWI